MPTLTPKASEFAPNARVHICAREFMQQKKKPVSNCCQKNRHTFLEICLTWYFQITHLISCYKCLAKFFWVKVVILYKTFFFQNSEAISATSKITYFFLILCSPIDGMARYGSSMAHSFSCLNIIFLSWCSLELMGPNFFVFSFFAKNEKKN